MSTNANPNGHIAIVFTYNGAILSYAEFLNTFYVTLPGGGGVQIGNDQYYGYASGTNNTITLGTSYALSSAATPIAGLLPSNATSTPSLQAALQNWVQNQAASPGQAAYANLYLSHYTGGRVYLSNGDLGLGASGEPTPAAPTDNAYDLVYDIFEPYIGAQVGNSTVAGNLADITDIDWFSFPVTLKTWSYDFGNPTSTSLTVSSSNEELGGDGSNIYKALLIAGSATSPTNQYPNTHLPTSGGSTTACRLAGPTMAAAAQSYYTDPAQNPFPYHYFDGYLVYLQTAQGSNESLFTLSGTFAGIGADPTQPNLKAQTFSFDIDFSNIKTETRAYPSGSVTQISPDSSIVFTGYTDQFGCANNMFTITLPWAKGVASYALQSNPTISPANDAIRRGWLTIVGNTPTAASGTYSPVDATALDANGKTIAVQSGTTQLQLIYSVNAAPLSGKLDDLYQDGKGTMLTITGLSGLTCTPTATYTQVGDKGTVIIIKTDSKGLLSSIQINDLGVGPLIDQGAAWTIHASAIGLGNNQAFTVTLNQAPPLRNVFVLNTATYLGTPASLSVTPAPNDSFSLDVTSTGQFLSGWQPDATWTTLCQPAGIYGANTGYTIAGILGNNASYNGDVKSLQNDLFGWVVADLLAALNTGLAGSPVVYNPATGKTIGESSDQWFKQGDNPYTKGLWGANAWIGQTGANGKPITDFWNTWAYDLYTVPGGTGAYGFAFSDRFEAGILLGFNPPPSQPSSVYPVLLEVIVGDSPLLAVELTVQSTQTWLNTGINIAPGKTMTIAYQSGTWTADPNTNNGHLYDANGCPGITVTQPGYPLPGVNMGALVGQVGSNPVFLIGDGPIPTPSGQSGTLKLCINDDLKGLYGPGLKDNSGSVTVKINAD